ncbi:uncharacterized protein [Parasteatoda tepidariorum]|uniref:uncharacterized protein isoform X1 n=1 Tax=Parasteatoda tepidariorum TaxID=114398 RepID=UPI001C71D018|nr:uncharacterized protein LOC107439755 isoform X1 [Parasteatoda tepidariorum]XP_042900268.1 uncharacterized protein LOC107439755 isoform X1 [Parasteatoda tepidariorum]
MLCLYAAVFCISLFNICLVYGWKQPELEYNEDSFGVGSSPKWDDGNEKRNDGTWWTKKSIHEEEFSNGCSLEKCMMLFKDCLRQAESKNIFMHCKETHLSCLASCFRKYKERFLFNSVALDS